MRRKYIYVLILIFFASTCFAGGVQDKIKSVVARKNAAAPAANYLCTDATHDSANNAITLCEDYDGAADCGNDAGNAQNCRNAWTGVGVYTTAGLDNTYSVGLDSTSATNYAYKAITSANDYYVFFKLKVVALPATSGKTLALLQTAGTARGTILMNTTGTLRVNNGTANATTADAVSAGNTYYIWFGYTKGTGADGVGYVGFSTDTTKPTSGNKYASVSTGDANAAVDRLFLGNNGAANAVNYTIDRVRVNTSDFGDNPL